MGTIKQVYITDEIKTSFIDYAMSVIVARALPDVRDGLKPVHRRVLYAMNDLGITADKPYKKSARITGEVIGKYHPHGDQAVYETMVRMAQDFSMRYMLVDGHGNFGSIDGDQAAAMRYTEARLSKIAMEMLRDINKNTVDFGDNYDGSEKEPLVLPSRFPNLLVNGSTGIAVGMATNIPPHNLSEVIDAIFALIDNPDLTVIELMEYIKGPDFPTGATILGNSGIKKAYETGKGIIKIRANCEIVKDNNGRESIIVTEIPYQVNKANLVEKIANLVKEEKITGISDLRDESNMYGIRIVIEIKKDANANIVLNNLYNAGILQVSYGINMLALVNSEPKLLSLKEMLGHYIDFQKEVITRRTQFDLEKAETRAHILEGLIIALENIDEVVVLIKKSKNDEEAKKGLIEKFKLSSEQATAILEMKLRRLTGLERSKIEEEMSELKELIAKLKAILASEEKVLGIVKEELLEIKEKYGDERKTKIDLTAVADIDDESLIPVEDIVITVTNKGYIKRLPVDTYRTQHRGGIGVKGMTTNEEDFVEYLLSTKTHTYILFFTNKGKVYRLKGFQIPEYGRQSKGLPLINLIPIEKDERLNAIIPIEEFTDGSYLFFATRNGLVKRTPLIDFENIRQTGKIAITLKENDELISVRKTSGKDEIIMGSSNGKLIRFKEKEIRSMGRTASGVRGMNLDGGECVGMEVVIPNSDVLVVSEKGYGKRTSVEEYRVTHRGGKGVKTINIIKKNGKLVALRAVDESYDLMIITDQGIVIRLDVSQISRSGRVTQGVKLINLRENQSVATVARVKKEDDSEENNSKEAD